jgi:hypothetical protein
MVIGDGYRAKNEELTSHGLPPDHLLQKFNRAAGLLFQKVYSNLSESRTLAALRDALLRKDTLKSEYEMPASDAGAHSAKVILFCVCFPGVVASAGPT